MALRLCFVGPPRAKGTHTSISSGYEKAAESLGMEVLPALVFVPAIPIGGRDKAAYDRACAVMGVDVRRETNWQRTPLEKFLEFKPDLICFNEFAFLWTRSDRQLILNLRRRLKNTAFVGMYWDEPWCWPITSRRTARYFYDWACTNEPTCVGRFGPKGLYLPHAYNPDMKAEPLQGAKPYPLLMVGNPLPPRVDWLSPIFPQLDRMGLGLIGNGWPFPSMPIAGISQAPPGIQRMDKEHAFWFVQKAKLCINLHRGRNSQLPPAMKGGWYNKDTFWNHDPLGVDMDDPRAPYRLSDLQALNERIFDYSALGVLQVVDWRSYIVEALPEIPTVQSPSELVATCRRLLADPAERAERLRKTWARVQGHTFVSRLIYLMKAIGVADLTAKAPPGARLSPWDFSPRVVDSGRPVAQERAVRVSGRRRIRVEMARLAHHETNPPRRDQ